MNIEPSQEAFAVFRLFFGHFEKNSRPKKLMPKKNSSKLFKNSIICQLKTDFLLKKVLKLTYFAQKFATTKF